MAGYKMFLSRRALTELGVLLAGFPNHIIKATAASMTSRTCSCLTQEMEPPPPEWPAARIASREKLESILIEHYQRSVFNMCEHQWLSAMSDTPLHVQLKEGANGSK